MELKQLTLVEFIDALASDSPTPGGGSASALAASVGASLASMVAGLTLGREKYKEHEEVVVEAAECVAKLRESLVCMIDRDAAAYNSVSDVLRMPKSTDEEKSQRREAMQYALKAAVVSPFEVMQLGLAALNCIEKLQGRSNINAVSDLGVAALNLKAAIQGAWLNVLINLNGITDDQFIKGYRGRGSDILDTATSLADDIYVGVLKGLEN